MVGLVNLVYRGLLVHRERKERQERMAFLDPREKEETQVYRGGASLVLLDRSAAKATKAALVFQALQVILVSLASKETRGLQESKGPRASQERGAFQEPH